MAPKKEQQPIEDAEVVSETIHLTTGEETRKAREQKRANAMATWAHKTQKQKIEMLVNGFASVSESTDILADMNSANHFLIVAIMEKLGIDKEEMRKRSNELFVEDLQKQNFKPEEVEKPTEEKVADAIPDQNPEA